MIEGASDNLPNDIAEGGLTLTPTISADTVFIVRVY